MWGTVSALPWWSNLECETSATSRLLQEMHNEIEVLSCWYQTPLLGSEKCINSQNAIPYQLLYKINDRARSSRFAFSGGRGRGSGQESPPSGWWAQHCLLSVFHAYRLRTQSRRVDLAQRGVTQMKTPVSHGSPKGYSVHFEYVHAAQGVEEVIERKIAYWPARLRLTRRELGSRPTCG